MEVYRRCRFAAGNTLLVAVSLPGSRVAPSQAPLGTATHHCHIAIKSFPVRTVTMFLRKKSSLTSNILGRPPADIRDKFLMGKELGKGQFGVTYLCTDKVTGEQLACKSLAKRRIGSKEEVEDIRKEIAIMHHLGGHPHIVQLRGAFEDKHNVHIVMELCAGGELFDRIAARGHYSERAASALFKTMMGVVDHCHQNNVIHRDLKPENFLLADRREDAPLKVADFGLSSFYKEGEVFTETVGSAFYVAPEVLKGKYDKACDVWSCGVILFILLSGTPPFWGDTEKQIFHQVLKATPDFAADPWPQVSDSAKDLVKRMLHPDPSVRISSADVLRHPWLSHEKQSDKPLGEAVLKRIKKFSAANKMKKLALKVIACNLSREEILGLKKLFKGMDKDGSGSITFAELKTGMQKLGNPMSEEQLQQIMEAADMDHSGTIDYTEFITATMQMNKVEKEEHIWKAFQHFDRDGSGFITVSELRDALANEDMLEPGELEQIIEEVDTDKPGELEKTIEEVDTDKAPYCHTHRLRSQNGTEASSSSDGSSRNGHGFDSEESRGRSEKFTEVEGRGNKGEDEEEREGTEESEETEEEAREREQLRERKKLQEFNRRREAALLSRDPSTLRYAYVTLLCDDVMAPGALVLVHSLKRTGTPHDVVVLTMNVSEGTAALLQLLGARVKQIEEAIPYPFPATPNRVAINKPCRWVGGVEKCGGAYDDREFKWILGSGMVPPCTPSRTGTLHDVVVLTMNVSDGTAMRLQLLGARVKQIEEAIRYSKLLMWTLTSTAWNTTPTYSKLWMWTLTEYHRLVYVDADLLVMSSLDDLFCRDELSAAPDTIPPDRFNSGLMVVAPSDDTFRDMLSKVATTKSPNVGDQGLLNNYFSDWYSQGPSHHLPYAVNPLVRLSPSPDSASLPTAPRSPPIQVVTTKSPNVGDQGFLNNYFSDWYSQGPSHHLPYAVNPLVRLSPSPDSASLPTAPRSPPIQVATTKSPNVGDQGFLNNYFSDWYSQGPSHHLPYAVNPLFRLSPSPDSASLPTAPRSPPIQVATTKSPNVGDQGFLNNYFSDWYSQGPSHHLPYAFNPLVRLSGWEGWEKFVQPQLRVLHFSGSTKPWNTMEDKQAGDYTESG
ncbi:unnamed protein product [Closterium sp. Naga37s-1]|nr:unnamed protein product [Closterium sp. Naga37s-1]